jgi:hypothetical protein
MLDKYDKIIFLILMCHPNIIVDIIDSDKTRKFFVSKKMILVSEDWSEWYERERVKTRQAITKINSKRSEKKTSQIIGLSLNSLLTTLLLLLLLF